MPDGTHEPVSGQQGLVLALLASSHPHPVPVSTLLEELWPSRPPRSAATGLRVVINRLRERLTRLDPERDPIEHRDHGYVLTLETGELDHQVFIRAAGDAGNHDDGVGEGADGGRAAVLADGLADALRSWRGRAFEPYDDSPRLSSASAELEALRRDTEERLVQALLDSGRHDRAAVLATSLVEAEPYRERRWEQLMAALYHTGRQAEALQAGARVRALLAEDLGIEPGPRLAELELAILHHDPGLGGVAGIGTGGVVPDEFTALLRHPPSRIPNATTSYLDPGDRPPLPPDAPVLTIVGPPGVGKSRLAVRYVTGAAETGPAGTGRHHPTVDIVWLDLIDTAFTARPGASLRDALAAALDLRPTDRPLEAAVAELVSTRGLVIVFDNAEHLTGVVAELAEQLVAACPDLRVVVTSRVPLACRSEKIYPLHPLPTTTAVDLLIERAPIHIDADRDRSELIALVNQVDGIPLAIELVAPHLATMPPRQLTERLALTLEPAAGRGRSDHRHQSMEQAIAWSVDLLEPGDRHVLAPLGVMAGRFTTAQLKALLERADRPLEPVGDRATGSDDDADGGRRTAGDTTVDRSLRRLAEHGLIRSSTSPGSSASPGSSTAGLWTVPNTTAAFVAGRVDRAHPDGSGRPWGRLHAELHLDLACRLAEELSGEREERAVAELRRLAPQVSAAHRWFVTHHRAEASAELVMATWEGNFFRQVYDRYRWPAEALELEGVDELDRYGDLLGLGALAAWARDRLVTSRHLADRAEAVATERGQPVPLTAYKARFNVAVHEDRPAEAASWLDRLLAESSDRGDRRHHADNLVVAALGLSQVGFPSEAGRLAREADALATTTGNPTSVAWARVALAAAEVQDRPERATRTYSAAARLARTVHNRWVANMASTGLVTALRRQGRREQARAILIEVTGLWARAQQQGLLSRSAQEAVLVLAHDSASAGELDRAAAVMARLERTGYAIQLLPDDQDRFDALATALGGRATVADPGAGAPGLGRVVIDALA